LQVAEQADAVVAAAGHDVPGVPHAAEPKLRVKSALAQIRQQPVLTA
jgi:hypothetical protein